MYCAGCRTLLLAVGWLRPALTASSAQLVLGLSFGAGQHCPLSLYSSEPRHLGRGLIASGCAALHWLPPSAEAGISHDSLYWGTCRSDTSSSAVGGSCDTAQGFLFQYRGTPEPSLPPSKPEAWQTKAALPIMSAPLRIGLQQGACTWHLRDKASLAPRWHHLPSKLKK